MQLPPDHDPFALRLVAATAFPAKRLIAVLYTNEKSDRYSLHRFPNGSVSWRADSFTSPEDPAEPERWIAHHGELTVGQVVERLPEHRRAVLDWTRSEISSGVEIIDAADPSVRERRARSLARLRADLDAASGGAAADRAA